MSSDCQYLSLCQRREQYEHFVDKEKRSPSVSRDQNRRYDQREEREEYSQYATSDSAMPRSPSDYADRRSQHEPQFYEESDHINYRDSNRRSHRHSKEYIVDDEDVESRDEYERQRREEEYQARYRSDPNLARYPVKPQPYEEQMRIHAEVSRARHERRHSDVSLANAELEDSRISMLRMERPSRQRSISERRAAMENQRSYSMERTREAQGPSSYPQRTTNHSPPTPRRSPIPIDRPDMRRTDSLRKQHHLDPSSAVRKTKREKMETMLRNDSLSSDQSESVRPPPPKPHKSKKGGKMRQVSLSSSEEELASTPEYTSCDDVEIESESVSEKGKHYILIIHLPHPVTWQPSKDGDRLIGRILLNKRLKDGSVPRDSGAMLGLKVVGGKMTESGRLCAFITKVKKGSLADTVGHLRPGDEVLEWNGRVLQGATFEEVYNIILESKPEPQVELVVSRPIGDIPRIPDSTHTQLESSSSSFESQKMDRPSISVTSPMSPGMLRDVPQFLSGQLSSQSLSRRTTPFVPRVQIKLWFDKVGHQLIVTILGAKDLPSREDGRPRNPYVKIYFLPDRSDKNKRRTKTVKKTLEPKWNQTFIYSPVHRREFRERMLEITLWDQARVREEESEFLGEILIELETALLDDEPHWYKLQTHDVSSLPLPHPSPYMPRRQLHGESPTRRLQSNRNVEQGLRGTRSATGHYNTISRMDRHRVMDDHYSPDRDRSHPRTGSVQTSPSSTPVAGRRGRQLPQLPPKGTLERSAMDIEERNRQMKINKYKQVAGSDPRLEQDYHAKGLEEGGKQGDEHEEIVHAEEEVKEERTKEKEKGKDSTNMCNKEENRESGKEERAPDTPEPGKEKEQWNKEDLQKQFSQDDDRNFEQGENGKSITARHKAKYNWTLHRARLMSLGNIYSIRWQKAVYFELGIKVKSSSSKFLSLKVKQFLSLAETFTQRFMLMKTTQKTLRICPGVCILKTNTCPPRDYDIILPLFWSSSGHLLICPGDVPKSACIIEFSIPLTEQAITSSNPLPILYSLGMWQQHPHACPNQKPEHHPLLVLPLSTIPSLQSPCLIYPKTELSLKYFISP
ncbi:hypothetical protein FD754_010806 [Muntiacus muntjak]|uniref:PDZ domain-containing protein n=1 Tax=Muntiacus muntjak TaxID=9888 RepID=A0A5N3WXT6_MUNMU|nr:hypothetical protein FD754_010806 [Muntiacus muntjak]